MSVVAAKVFEDKVVMAADSILVKGWPKRNSKMRIVTMSTGRPWFCEEDNGLCVDIMPKIQQGLSELLKHPKKYKPRVSDTMSALAYSTAANASLLRTWLQDLNSAWENLGDDYELKDESKYQGTDPISFEELMDFGGESK